MSFSAEDGLDGIQMENFLIEAAETITVRLFISSSPVQIVEDAKTTDLTKDEAEILEVKQFISAETVALAKYPT